MKHNRTSIYVQNIYMSNNSSKLLGNLQHVSAHAFWLPNGRAVFSLSLCWKIKELTREFPKLHIINGKEKFS
jgi:hypothetical protein